MKTPKRYHPLLVTLHWLTVIFMLGAGLLSEQEGRSPITIHMIFGALLLLILIVRLIVRFSTPRPAPADAGNAFFNKVGEWTHTGLYLIVFFILGLGGAMAYGRNLIAYVFDNTVAISRAGEIGDIHHLGWFLAVMLILLHVGAALYHQFILKDNIFARMWYGK